MNRRYYNVRNILSAALIGVTLAAAHAAAPAPGTGDVARCASITAADERLACYDALTRPAPPPSSKPQQAAPADVKAFGITPRSPPVSSDNPGMIKAVVTKITENSQHRVDVLLDNGQTWIVSEPDAQVRTGEAVTIKRALLGSFMLTTSTRHSYRVERMQ